MREKGEGAGKEPASQCTCVCQSYPLASLPFNSPQFFVDSQASLLTLVFGCFVAFGGNLFSFCLQSIFLASSSLAVETCFRVR